MTALGVRVFLRRATASEKDAIVVAESRQLVKRHTILGKAALDESEVGRGELLPTRIAGVFYAAFNYFGRWSQAMTGVFARILTNPVRPMVPRLSLDPVDLVASQHSSIRLLDELHPCG